MTATRAELVAADVAALHRPAEKVTRGDSHANCEVCEYGNWWPCRTWRAVQGARVNIAEVVMLHHPDTEGFCATCTHLTEWPCATFQAATSGSWVRYVRVDMLKGAGRGDAAHGGWV